MVDSNENSFLYEREQKKKKLAENVRLRSHAKNNLK